MIRINELQETVNRKVDTREVKHKPFLAVVVSVHGSIHPRNRPSLVWISEDNQPESRHVAYSGDIMPIENQKVWVQKSPKPPHNLEIVKLYTAAMDPSSTVSPLSVPMHGINHQYPSETNIGFDPVLIYQPAIQMLKTTGNGTDLTVYTQPYTYVFGGVLGTFSGYFSDMTAYLPAAGNAVRVLIYFDPATGLIDYVSGTEVVIGASVPYPSVPTGMTASAYVLLEDGQTEVTTADHVTDSRDFLGGGSSAISSATEIGQILYSADGATFTAQLPMTNRWGVMINSDGIIMVV